jgi:ATP-dependent DNA helicase RecG
MAFRITRWADLSLAVERLHSVGPRNVSRLHRLGIRTLKQLLWHFPARYDDYSQEALIDQLEPGEKVHVQGEVVMIKTKRIFPRRLTITDAVIQDGSGAVKAVWFNQPYLEDSMPVGTLVSLAGTVKLDKRGMYLSNPAYEKIGQLDPDLNAELRHTKGLVPVYPETDGLSSKYLRFLIKPLLEGLSIEDSLPAPLVKRLGLMDLSTALHTIHYPETIGEVDVARQRLAFDDLLLFQMKALLDRRAITRVKSVPLPFDQDYIKRLITNLPFELTKDQKVAAWEILKDLEKPYPMNRLLEGDVGSGKTVVALIAAAQAARHSYQAVFLAPTEVLATQHYATIAKLTQGLGICSALLTSAFAQVDGEKIAKPALKTKIAKGQVHVIVGTHAMIQKDVSFKSLALVVIDEQHRFGIQQRAALLKATGNKWSPHLLSMTATPIPRTLALTIFGDLDISIIKEKPKNRQPIITQIVSSLERNAMYAFVRQQVKEGRQVFVICPKVEAVTEELKSKSPLWADVKAVEEEYKKLSEDIFADLKVAMLHGCMKPKEKQRIMSEFKDGWHDILVSTSVIEVGVDVPNATVMMIESAERFGLAQLHQFRGRVGRGQHQSFCLLFSSAGDVTTNKRLQALATCDDGFELAEKDMAIRGPGEFFGTKQSGLPDLTMAALADVELIKKARLQARTILKDDPSLTRYPLLKDRLEQFQQLSHFE